MKRLKAVLLSILTWPPLNRVLTDALRARLPPRVQRHPTFVRYARRVGVVEAPLPDGQLLRMCSRGDDDIVGPLFWLGWAGHEPDTARIFYGAAASARITLDIGAHLGYFALLAAHANPAGQVYAFEPLIRVREGLERNVALNAAANVRCVAAAAGSPAGSAEFFHVRGRGMPSSSSLSRSFMESVASAGELTSAIVEVVEIDDFVDEHELVGIDLVKVDTETTEDAVFRGMLRTLRRDRPQIVCELLDAGVGRAIEAMLEPLGYDFFRSTARGLERCDHLLPDRVWHNFILRPRH